MPEVNSLNFKFSKIDAAKFLRELAKQAGMNIHFRDPIKVIIDVNGVASTPIDAMNSIIDKIGGNISIEGGDIWVSIQSPNPLLAFSEKDFIEGANLRGLALGVVLRALGQMGKLNILLDRSLEPIQEKPVEILLSRMSYRRAFEHILKNNGLAAKTLDSKTLLILSEKAARTKYNLY